MGSTIARINFSIIFNLVGILLTVSGVCMWGCVPVSLYYDDQQWLPMVLSGLVTVVAGVLLWYFTRHRDKAIKKREGYLIVTLGWLGMSLAGSLPFLFTGAIPSVTDAFFETISGFTTTGASVVNDIEALPHSILFWRSFTHWIGGMGIIVLTVAILPILGIGGMELFVAEAPGPQAEKLHPRITQTAKRLWFIYVCLTLAQTVLLKLGPMGWFDALNHAMATVSTGGFSTKNMSLAHWNSSYIHWVVTGFMFVAGANFVLSYFVLKGRIRKVLTNEEFKIYGLFCLVATIVVTISIYPGSDLEFEEALRGAAFQVVTVITTTGFVTEDYSVWPPLAMVVIFLLMFTGGSAGSTAGGIKVVRHVIAIKNTVLEFKRILHPSAVIPARFNGTAVGQKTVYNVLGFILIYILLFCVGVAILSAMEGVSFSTAVGASIASLGNIGPGWGDVGPSTNYADLPGAAKWVLSFLMLLGRLEVFTVLIVLTPYFWKKA